MNSALAVEAVFKHWILCCKCSVRCHHVLSLSNLAALREERRLPAYADKSGTKRKGDEEDGMAVEQEGR